MLENRNCGCTINRATELHIVGRTTKIHSDEANIYRCWNKLFSRLRTGLNKCVTFKDTLNCCKVWMHFNLTNLSSCYKQDMRKSSMSVNMKKLISLEFFKFSPNRAYKHTHIDKRTNVKRSILHSTLYNNLRWFFWMYWHLHKRSSLSVTSSIFLYVSNSKIPSKTRAI